MNENIGFGRGSTDSSSPGTTSGWFDDLILKSFYCILDGINWILDEFNRMLDWFDWLLGRTIWELFVPINSRFLNDHSTGQKKSGLEGLQAWKSAAEYFMCLLSCVLIYWLGAQLTARLVAWGRVWKETSCKLGFEPGPDSRLQLNPSRQESSRSAEGGILSQVVQERAIAGLPYETVHQLKTMSNPLRENIQRDIFYAELHGHHELTFENVTLTAPYFFVSDDGAWQCAGYDPSLLRWRRLPPFTFLPSSCKPDLDLFKEYLICTKEGIFCINASKSSEDRLIVFNPLTGKWKDLPQLNHRRKPVLMHLVVDEVTQSYQVVVAGSSKAGDERLSKMTEVFDSRTRKWKITGDLPGPAYALNDYQSGVYKDGSLVCIAFLDQGGRSFLRYDMNKEIWLMDWSSPLPFSTNSTILQLLESWGEIYLFSEQVVDGHGVEHCVDRVEWDDVDVSLHNVVRSRKVGGRSLETFPEHSCISYSEHQLCVFNTINHSGVVYDVRSYGRSEDLYAPPPGCGFRGESFFTLNPMCFPFQLSSRSNI